MVNVWQSPFKVDFSNLLQCHANSGHQTLSVSLLKSQDFIERHFADYESTKVIVICK